MAKRRREFSGEIAEQIWKRVYPVAIPNYAAMNGMKQSDARQELKQRVNWRKRSAKPRD